MYNDREIGWFHKMGKTPPAHYPHGTEQDIAANMQQIKPHSWRLEGNKLIGQSDVGELVQTIPTDFICTGTGDDGLPVFQKVVY